MIELIPVELAGRGRRIHETPYSNIEEAVEDAYAMIKTEMAGAPYSLFGHSMGSMICYELAQKIRQDRFPQPMHHFFSGRGAPHIKDNEKKDYENMNDEYFKKEVLELGGTPPELFDHPELMDLFMPLLRNDFKITGNWTEWKEIRPLWENITVFLGKDDDQTPEQCDGWKKHTRKICNIHYFEGGHFFLHDNIMQIVSLINNTLRNAFRSL